MMGHICELCGDGVKDEYQFMLQCKTLEGIRRDKFGNLDLIENLLCLLGKVI